MVKTRLFGESISPEVVKQLERRAEVLSRGIRNSNDLRYLNEKTSWVRMISGVDTQDAENNFTSEEAKGFILSGGELEWDGKRFIRRRGFNTGNNEEERGRYNYDKDLGIRPEAGVTSFSIKHIGTYGSLREANITFNVWTKKDLEKAQNLFLRPGVSIIIEWGNAIYLDNTGNIKDVLELENIDTLFTRKTVDKVTEILNSNKEKNSFNYDAFVGYVTNFTWSFRNDGGYDCSLKIISKGAILETLSTYKSTNQALREAGGRPIKQFNNEQTEETKTYLHYVLSLLDSYASYTDSLNSTFQQELQTNVIDLLEKQGITPNPQNENVFFHSVRVGTTNTSFTNYTYISLNTFCALLNIGFSFQTPDGSSLTSFFVDDKSNDFILPSYCTSDSHFSLNPSYCILSKSATLEKEEISIGGVTTELSSIDSTKILSIHLNLSEVIKDLNSVYDGVKDPSQANVFDFIKKVLNKLSLYLGSINSFDLFFEEDLQKWLIVDRNCIFPKNVEDENKVVPERIDVTGLKSTITDISLESQITPNLSSQIAISAAATSRQTGTSVNLPLLNWNSKIIDRFSLPELSTEKENIQRQINEPTAQQTVTQQMSDATGGSVITYTDDNGNVVTVDTTNLTFPSQEDFDRKLFVENAKTVYSFLKKTEFSRNLKAKNAAGKTTTIGIFYVNTSENIPNLEKELYEKFKSEAITRFNLTVYGSESTSSTISNSGLIPIELQITLDGISGLKIGQIFTLGTEDKPSNILPSIYDSYGFIIIGLDAAVENNKWYTTIRGYTFKLSEAGNKLTSKL